MQKLYIRQGRRFVQTGFAQTQPTNHVGEYVTSNGTFTKDRNSLSVGMCVMQEGNVCTIAQLNVIEGISWYDAMKMAERQGKHLPTQKEVIALMSFEGVFKHDHGEWTQHKYSSSTAWFWLWLSSDSFAYFSNDYKDYAYQYYCARFFYTIEV